MVNPLNELQLLDIVALKDSLPEHRLLAGQIGTIVELLAPNVYEVDFSDDHGQTYAMLPLHANQLEKQDFMTQDNPHSPASDSTNLDDGDDLLPEYDFSQGMRSNRQRAEAIQQQGYSVTVHHKDGTTTTLLKGFIDAQ